MRRTLTVLFYREARYNKNGNKEYVAYCLDFDLKISTGDEKSLNSMLRNGICAFVEYLKSKNQPIFYVSAPEKYWKKLDFPGPISKMKPLVVGDDTFHIFKVQVYDSEDL